MNLHGLQSALAHVLRSYGQEEFLTIEELAARYDLKEPEIFQLRHVLNQNGLKSYGEELSHARWHIIQEGMGFLMSTIGECTLEELWQSFEPQCLRVVQQELTMNFLHYLINDQTAMEKLCEASVPYARALIQYTYCVFTLRAPFLPTLNVAKNSMLTGRFFMMQDLDYDVRELFAMLVDEHTGETIPNKRALTLLFIAGDEQMSFRSFEIDNELRAFFLDQLSDNPGNAMLPECFEDLCAMGLCK